MESAQARIDDKAYKCISKCKFIRELNIVANQRRL